MTRFLLGVPAMLAAVCVPALLLAQAPKDGAKNGMATRAADGTVQVSVFDLEGNLVGPMPMKAWDLTEAEWKERLSEEQFRILRTDGTEAAFCGTLLDNKMEGVYACAGCGLPLFSSDAKFNSGTGWPSFFQPIAEGNVTEVPDNSYGMVRTEIECTRCRGHLGHVFPDGPPPTGMRHCLNSESLTFTEKTDLASLGEVSRVVLAGGCFWCVEAVFEQLKGVYDVESGYIGGDDSVTDYRSVTTGSTGHAEAVRITYDPKAISYEELLKVHFATHDPTTLNRQGADVGTQYRSAIFYRDAEEKAVAEAFIADLTEQKVFGEKKIVTTLEPRGTFHVAEPYHQDYVCENPMNGYVRAVALPKVEKVREKFADKVKEGARP